MRQALNTEPPEPGPHLGHPRALLVILLCQAGFAFSISGMQSISVLYLSAYIFQPEHIGHIIGFGPVRTALAQIAGSSSPSALASVEFGVVGAFAYLTPLIGGLISDRILTRSQAVILGAALCAAGQLLVAEEASFLIGLVVLLAGIGLVGVNIMIQLGDMYAHAHAKLADAFQYMNICVNVAAILGPLVCGGLAQGIAWRWGFVAAAAGMSLGLVAYAAGLRHLPAEPISVAAGRVARPALTYGDGTIVIVLVSLLPALILVGLANGQIGNAYLIWASSTYSLQAFGHAIPASWLVALDSVFSVAAGLAVLAFWRLWVRKRALPNDITRIAVGGFIAASAPLVLALASVQQAATGQQVNLGWAVAFHALDNLGMAMVGPTALALFARVAPRAVAGLMMGVLNADAFGGALAAGVLGSLLGRMTGTHFWLLYVGLVAAGGVLLLLIRIASGSLFRVQQQAHDRNDEHSWSTTASGQPSTIA